MKYLVICIAMLLLACTNNSKESPEAEDRTFDAFGFSMLDSEAVDNAVSLKKASNLKLIKESYLVFETKNIDETYADIVSIIKKYDGYIQDDSAEKNSYRNTRRLIVRIPTINFQNTIDDVSEKVEYFDSKQTTLRDVTEEFIDLEARLKAKQELEKRYLDLLKQAKNVQELLEIERELSHIREEIEAKQGRLKYLQNKVSLSSINIEFYKINSESKVTKSYGSKMWQAIVSGFDGLSSFFLGILNIWPLILILTIIVLIIKRWLKKRNKK